MPIFESANKSIRPNVHIVTVISTRNLCAAHFKKDCKKCVAACIKRADTVLSLG